MGRATFSLIAPYLVGAKTTKEINQCLTYTEIIQLLPMALMI
jgi:hypothetical protein